VGLIKAKEPQNELAAGVGRILKLASSTSDSRTSMGVIALDVLSIHNAKGNLQRP